MCTKVIITKEKKIKQNTKLQKSFLQYRVKQNIVHNNNFKIKEITLKTLSRTGFELYRMG